MDLLLSLSFFGKLRITFYIKSIDDQQQEGIEAVNTGIPVTGV